MPPEMSRLVVRGLGGIWWRRRVLPPGPNGLLRRPFIAIAEQVQPQQYRVKAWQKKGGDAPQSGYWVKFGVFYLSFCLAVLIPHEKRGAPPAGRANGPGLRLQPGRSRDGGLLGREGGAGAEGRE